VVANRHGIGEQTIYMAQAFGSFQANDIKRLKQFEAENARLKKSAAERDLKIEVMRKSPQKTGERAGLSAGLRALGLGA
jgi:putative transposase